MLIYSKFCHTNLHFFLFPKFLELFFTPKNTPSKVKNSKMGLNQIFLGTPCRLLKRQPMLCLVEHAPATISRWIVVMVNPNTYDRLQEQCWDTKEVIIHTLYGTKRVLFLVYKCSIQKSTLFPRSFITKRVLFFLTFGDSEECSIF